MSIAKQICTDHYSEFWQSFLVGEVSSPTVQFAGICPVSDVRFQQHIDTFDIELDLPGIVDQNHVKVDVSPTSWRIDVLRPCGVLSRSSNFIRRVVPSDTVWMLDRNETASTLLVTLRKQDTGYPHDAIENWWPGLSKPT